MLGEPACVVLGVDEFSIDNNVKNAAAALDELHLGVERLLYGDRQTGGVRAIVSFNAIGNRDLHGGMRIEAMRVVKGGQGGTVERAKLARPWSDVRRHGRARRGDLNRATRAHTMIS